MTSSKRQFLFTAVATATALTLAPMAVTAQSAADYPQGPITLIVPFPAGGGVDLVGRILAKSLASTFNQNVIVENRAGASGMIGAGYVAKANPDGRTILLASSGETAINPHLYSNMAYDPAIDLAPITNIARIPNVLAMHPDVPADTLEAFIEYARDRDDLSYSSSGVGNIQNISGELFNKLAGTQILHVPYKGSAQAVADVAGGQVTMTFASAAALMPFIESGRVKALGVSSEESLNALPNVPPISSVPAVADFNLVNWFGLFTTGGTPADIVDKLNEAAVAALNDPEVMQALENLGALPSPMTPAEFAEFREEQSRLFGDVVESAGITLDN